MLERAGHVTKIGGGAEQVPVRVEHVGDRRRERRPHFDVDALDARVVGAGEDGLEHFAGGRRRGVVDDQQRLAHWCSSISTAFFIVSRARLRSPA
jgi:hypothetical protein